MSMKGARRFGKGQVYIAFSRVNTLQGLHIMEFNEAGIKSKEKVLQEMSEMSQCPDLVTSLTSRTKCTLTVGHLNVHYFYLTKKHCINSFLSEHSYQSSRSDIPDSQNHQRKHGVMICASDNMNPRELNHICVGGIESKGVLVDTAQGRLVVVVVYRTPLGSMNTFLQHMDMFLGLLPLNVPTVITGDFNDNLANVKESQLSKLMTKYGFEQPTTDSGTLVDHIYFNRQSTETDKLYTDVCDTYYSDRDLTYLTFNIA